MSSSASTAPFGSAPSCFVVCICQQPGNQVLCVGPVFSGDREYALNQAMRWANNANQSQAPVLLFAWKVLERRVNPEIDDLELFPADLPFVAVTKPQSAAAQ